MGVNPWWSYDRLRRGGMTNQYAGRLTNRSLLALRGLAGLPCLLPGPLGLPAGWVHCPPPPLGSALETRSYALLLASAWGVPVSKNFIGNITLTNA